jgi:hypothetical protein
MNTPAFFVLFALLRGLRGSELVRTVRTDRELKLKQELVRELVSRVFGPPVLPADLAELARPVRQQQRLARIAQRPIVSVP